MGPNGSNLGTGRQYGDINQGVRKNNIKRLAIALLALLIIRGAVGFFIKKKIDTSNYYHEQANSLYEALVWTRTSSQCDTMVRNADFLYISSEKYNEYVETCRQNAKIIQESVENLKGASNNPEYTKIYDSVVSDIETEILLGDELEGAINTYLGWRTFSLYEQEAVVVSEEDVNSRADNLTNANSDLFSEWAKKWQKAKNDLVNLSLIKNTNNNTMAKYQAAEAVYARVMNEAPEFHDKYPLGHKLSDGSKLGSDIIRFYSYVKENL